MDRTIGIVFAEQYASELGNKLAELNPELNIIAIINLSNNTINYRTINNDINLGKMVKKYYNGGGHVKAAGNMISKNKINEILDIIFKLDK